MHFVTSMTWNSGSSCPLSSLGVADVHHQAWLGYIFIFNDCHRISSCDLKTNFT